MEGMLVLIVLVILLFLLLPSLITSSRFRRLDDSLNRIESELRNLKLEFRKWNETKESLEEQQPPAPVAQTIVPEFQSPPVVEALPEMEQQAETPLIEERDESPVEAPELSEILVREEISITETVFHGISRPVILHPIAEKIEKPSKDWEKFIGENLINKIGIAILTLGIGVFVKYAIDKDWINEVGRVVIGFLAAGLLLGIAHYMRKTYPPFSSVLVGGAIATMYFTIGIAFHEYKMFSQIQAFVLMAVITCFSVFISIAYNRIELAVIAQTGGFLTPFLVSTGDGNYIVLFTYLLILNLGLLTLAWYRKWHLVYIVSYAFTTLIFGGWLSTKYEPGKATGAMIFASSFYFLFSAAATIFTIRKNDKLQSVQFMILLSVNMLYFFAGLYIFDGIDDGKYKGLFTALLGIINFAAAYILYKKENLDKNFIYLLIGLVLTYITLVAPIQLKGNKITLFWAAEMVILMFIYTKSKLKLLRVASLVIWPLLLISLLMDWSGYQSANALTPLFNRFFISGIGTLVAMCLYIRLQLKNPDEHAESFQNLMIPVILIVGFITGLLETNHQFGTMGIKVITTGSYAVFLPDLIFALTYILVLQWISNRKGLLVYSTVAIAVFTILLLLCLNPGNAAIILVRSFALQSPNHPSWPFFMHYLLWPLLVLNFYFALNSIQKYAEKIMSYSYWVTAVFGLYFLSAEADHLTMWLVPNGKSSGIALNFTHRAIYPVLWGVTAFVIMYLGLKFKKRSLRIISLSVFGAILLKLFLVDIRSISEGGRIMAFITLGVILLVVSFLYQKLKSLLAKDETAETHEKN